MVVKAQVHAGGRGKAGGVKLADDAAGAEAAAKQILGMMLKTPADPARGHQGAARCWSRRPRRSPPSSTSRSRSTAAAAPTWSWPRRPAAWTSRRSRPRTRRRSSGSGRTRRSGCRPSRPATWPSAWGSRATSSRQASALIMNLFRAYLDEDCSLAEINPLVVTKDGRVLALDAKLNFDDNALYRHKDVVALRDINEETPLDVEASKYGLNYIKLDGNVGCMVNGAGLAMATMDIVKLAGGEPANFLDVGGGASPEQIENAFRILSSDPSVKAVFINVFGGILRCDRLAEGIIAAVKKLGLTLPVVVRAEGTNVEQGKKMLRRVRAWPS